MDLQALKQWFFEKAAEKGNAFWRVKRSSTQRKNLDWNTSEPDVTLSWEKLQSYLIGQFNQGITRFYIEVISGPKDGNPCGWEIGANKIAAVGGAARMTAQPVGQVNNALLSKFDRLEQKFDVAQEENKRLSHEFEMYKLRVEYEAKLAAERGKTAEALGQAAAIKDENKSTFEKFIDHPAVAPKAGMAIGRVINSIFPDSQQVAVAGAKAGETVPAPADQETTTETSDPSETEHYTEEENLVLDLLDNMKKAGITDAAERIYFTGMYALENWEAIKPMQDPIIAQMKAKRGIQ